MFCRVGHMLYSIGLNSLYDDSAAYLHGKIHVLLLDGAAFWL